MQSVLGWLLVAVLVATVVGFSIGSLNKPQSAQNEPATNVSTSTPALDTSVMAEPQNATGPTESGCPQEGHIKSPSSYDKATITFDNETPADVKIYWIGFDGKRKLYETLKAHTAINQATWIGHVWVVADQTDQCMKLESANAVAQTLVINL